MKINNKENSGIKSNKAITDTMDFGIGDASVIIEILRNRLYSNPIQTPVQEYISNGRDASREAKTNKPITVTMPTNIVPVFKVRDYGVGISPDRIADIFVLYGKSTKRDSNEQTGGFGIGAKSAWAYTDSFTVVSFYNGVEYKYLAHTGSNKNGQLVKISEEKTNEPNGTEIQIGVKEKDINEFNRAVYRTTLFWDQKPELKGITKVEIPKNYDSKKIVLKEKNWTVYKISDVANFLSNSSVVQRIVFSIDGIPYELPNSLLDNSKVKSLLELVNYDNLIVIDIANGDLQVSANRENIDSSNKNLDLIPDICANVVLEIEAKIRAEVFKNKTLMSFLQTSKDMFKNFSSKQRKYEIKFKNDYVITAPYIISSPKTDSVSIFQYKLANRRNGKKVVTQEQVKDIYLDDDLVGLFYLDEEKESPNKNRDRIRKYFKDTCSKKCYYIISNSLGSMKTFENFIADLELKGISTLPMEENLEVRKKRKSNKGKISVHNLITSYETSGYSAITKESLHLEESELVKKPTIYVKLEKDQKYPDNFPINKKTASLIFFLKKQGYNVYAVSIQATKKVEILENFYEYNWFVKNKLSDFQEPKELQDFLIVNRGYGGSLNRFEEKIATHGSEVFGKTNYEFLKMYKERFDKYSNYSSKKDEVLIKKLKEYSLLYDFLEKEIPKSVLETEQKTLFKVQKNLALYKTLYNSLGSSIFSSDKAAFNEVLDYYEFREAKNK